MSRYFFNSEFKKSSLTITKGVNHTLTTVTLRPNESQDQLFRRFRKKVVKGGALSVVRRKRWYVPKSELRRIQKKKAIRRIRRRQYLNNKSSQ